MLVSTLKHTCGSLGRVRASAGCVLRVQESFSQLFYSTPSARAPLRKEENNSESLTDPFLAHLQQKTEKELFEILRKQQQQQAPEQNGDEETQEPVTATGEHGGPKGAYAGAEPTRYGDWEKGGRCTDF